MIALLPSFKTNLFLLTGDLPPFTWNTSATVISSTLIPMTITFVSVTLRHYISFCDITFVSVTDLSIPPKFLETPFILMHLLVQTILICINDTLSLPTNIIINYWLNDFIITTENWPERKVLKPRRNTLDWIFLLTTLEEPFNTQQKSP